MANLRNQLLRAGLVDKKTKQQADTAARRKRKKKNKKKKGQAVEASELQRQAYDERIAAEAEENRRRAAEAHRNQAAHEQVNTAANLAGTWAIREQKPGPRRFCFVSRERKIRWFDLSDGLARKLVLGVLAIVERPGNTDEPHALVPSNIAQRMHRLDPELVRFWNREPVATDPENRIPSTEEASGQR